MSRTNLLREIFFKPIWAILVILWGLFRFAFDVLDTLGVETIAAREIILGNPLTIFLFNNWIWLTVLLFLAATLEGLFRKTRVYLGEEITANVNIIPYPTKRNEVNALDFRIVNREKAELNRCSARVVLLEHRYNPKMALDVLRGVNPDGANLVWASGNEVETLPRNGGEKVLRFCFDRGNDLGLSFFQHNSHYLQGKYHVVIEVSGYYGIVPMRAIRFDGCFLLRYDLMPLVPIKGQRIDPKTNEVLSEQNSVAGGGIMSFLGFVDCDNDEQKETS